MPGGEDCAVAEHDPMVVFQRFRDWSHDSYLPCPPPLTTCSAKANGTPALSSWPLRKTMFSSVPVRRVSDSSVCVSLTVPP